MILLTPFDCAYNSTARLWCFTFEFHGFIMYLDYDEVNDVRYNKEWGIV